MLHWLHIQLILTIQELHTALSIPHIVTGFVVYGIIHRGHRMVQKAEKRLATVARKERNRVIDTHVKTGHKSRFSECQQQACASLRNLGHPPLLTLEAEQWAELLEK